MYNELRKHMEKCNRLINEAPSTGDNEKTIQKLLKAVYETDCVSEMLLTMIKNEEDRKTDNELSDMFNSTASGAIEIVGDNWLYLRIETILPSDKNITGIKRISNTVTNLLDCYADYYGSLPRYEQAFVAIIEHTSRENTSSYDHDNKGYRAIPNALKGRVFDDDNQFVMSLGLFTVESGDSPHCDVYIIPREDIAEFSAQFLIN